MDLQHGCFRVFALDFCVADDYGIFRHSLHESDLWLDLSHGLNSGFTTNALVFPYPINHTKA